MRKLLAVTLIGAVIGCLIGSVCLAGEVPLPKVTGGVLINMIDEEPESTLTFGMIVGDLGMEFGIARDTVSFFPTVHKAWFFLGVLVTSELPTGEARRVSVALPLGLQADSSWGFLRFGYSYPVVDYIEDGLFVQFAFDVDFMHLITSGSE